MRLLCIESVEMCGEKEKDRYQAFTEAKEYNARKGSVMGLGGNPYENSNVLKAKNDKGESHIIKRLDNDELNHFFDTHFKEIK